MGTGSARLNQPSIPRVKICGITNLVDALAAAQFGADAIGLRIRPKLSIENAREIARRLPPFVSPVLLFRETDTDEITEICSYTEISVVQIYSVLIEEDIEMLRRRIQGLRIIKALAVTGKESLDEAKVYERNVEGILLDSFDPRRQLLGGTGMTHDWTISRSIVEASNKPVILAGGLNEQNISPAVEYVKPWGVDCETGVEVSDGVKDHRKMQRFILLAKGYSVANQKADTEQ